MCLKAAGGIVCHTLLHNFTFSLLNYHHDLCVPWGFSLSLQSARFLGLQLCENETDTFGFPTTNFVSTDYV